MAVTFEKLNNGEFNKDEKLTGDTDRLEEMLSVVSPTPLPEGFIPTPSAKENKKISMTVEEALNKMITVSDNYAALLLVSKKIQIK
jgi:D-alanyl-D-alanine carboxypeptidase